MAAHASNSRNVSRQIPLALRWLLRPASPLPPDLRIVGAVENLGQFQFDLAQAIGAQLESGLIDRIVSALFRQSGVQVAQIRDFLAKAGEMFRNIWHLFRSYALFGESPANSAGRAMIVGTRGARLACGASTVARGCGPIRPGRRTAGSGCRHMSIGGIEHLSLCALNRPRC